MTINHDNQYVETSTSRPGTLQTQRNLQPLLPSYFSVEERTTEDWLIYLKQFSEWLRFYSVADNSHTDWQLFLPSQADIAKLVAWVEGDTSVSDEIKAIAARPHMALLLAFIELQKHPRLLFDRFTERHLHYYYRDLLGLTEKSPKPDHCHLVLGLESTAESVVLPVNTAFDAGSDTNDNPRHYVVTTATGINHAVLQSLRSLSLEQAINDKNHVRFVHTTLVDGTQGISLPETSALTFGEPSVSDPQRQTHGEIALQVASPLLLLSEGERVIRLSFDKRFTSTLEKKISFEHFHDYFDFALTTSDGWVWLMDQPRQSHGYTGDDRIVISEEATEGVQSTFLIGTEYSGDAVVVEIKLTALFPAIQVPESQSLGSPELPQLKLALKETDSHFVKHYQTFKMGLLNTVSLHVSVKGLTLPLIRNDEGPLDPGGPMELFGSQPAPQAETQLTHTELSLKALDWLSVNLDWNNKPNDLFEYYKPYRDYLIATQDGDFSQWPNHQVAVGSAYHYEADQLLFESTSISAKDASTLYPENFSWPDYAELPLDNSEPREWPVWYGFRLGHDDFGHSLYASVTTWHANQYAQQQLQYQIDLEDYEDAKAAYPQALAAYTESMQHYQQALSEYQVQKSQYDQPWTAHWASLWFYLISDPTTSDSEVGLYDAYHQRIVRNNTTTTAAFNIYIWDNNLRLWTEQRAFNLSNGGNQQMADFLNSLVYGQSVVITSGNAIGTVAERSLPALVEAIENCGGSQSWFTNSNLSTCVFVGQARSGAGQGAQHNHDKKTFSLFSVTSNGSLAFEKDYAAKSEFSDKTKPLAAPYDRYDPPSKPIAPTEPQQPTAPASIDEPVIVPEPWTPTINSIQVDYEAKADFSVNQLSPTSRHQLYHLNPLGLQNLSDVDKKTFVSVFDNTGYLYLGFSQAPLGGTLETLFQIAPIDSADEDDTDSELTWSYMATEGVTQQWVRFGVDNQTKDTERALILSDETNTLLDSGIISFGLLAEMTRTGAYLGDNQLWLRAAVKRPNGTLSTLAWSELDGVYSQAVKVTYNDEISPPLHLPDALPANTIAALVEDSVEPAIRAAIGSVTQPFPSFEGRPAESPDAFAMRVSERLRHKGRALNLWDYERLVLEQFPEIFLANCQRVEGQGFHVRLLVVPKTADPELLKPTVPPYLRLKIQDYLQTLMSPVVQLDVRAPRFHEVQFDIALTFEPQYDPGVVVKTLNDELTAMLSPWVGGGESSNLKGSIYLSDVVTFVEQRDYVNLVMQVGAYLIKGDGEKPVKVEGSEIKPEAPDIVLVPAKKHILRALPEGKAIFEGISIMEIEYDFEVAPN
ncbi:baseplate J/gp47 family protein [Spartinivicinus poritis]|uniref:Baseplate J/gp47 family protein n=1 Tax=Spartinivicinus poritis TaxID=2994640 RepID=A0ABT5U6Y0_9GAMM|nr:baseplate J/gp47 family protein [Spartinivicinus sp. A2-2]MDE1462126.1 baseplate J/gp47 family protein [Spartinivicinus sp. A2-2]